MCMLTLALLYSLTAFSQEGTDAIPYDSILVVGRTWKCVKVTYSDIIRYYETYSVIGNEMLEGKNYRKLLCVSKYTDDEDAPYVSQAVNYGLEEDNALYWITRHFTYEFFRVDYQTGDMETGEKERLNEVAEVDSVFVGGKQRKRIIFPSYRVIEGIGVSNDLCLPGPFSSNFRELREVYDNGELIATKEDFYKEGTTGISTVKIFGKPEPLLYDLAGRRLSDRPAKGIYIENGRKVCR